MIDSRSAEQPITGYVFPKLALLLIASMISVPLFAEEAEFTTSDGKYTTRGVISSFIDSDGKSTKLPRSLNLETQVIIELADGTKTRPIPMSQLSKKTRTTISKHIARQRKLAGDDKAPLTAASKTLLDHQAQLRARIEKHAGLGAMDQIEGFEKEQYLEEIRDYRKDIGREATSDVAIHFILSYLEGEYGENKYGVAYLLAKDTKNFWPAWQSTVIFSLRYRQNLSDTIKLMNQYLDELGTVAKQKPNAQDPVELKKAGRAALWLREAAAIVEKSGLADDSELKRLKQIQISTTVVTLIKTSGIPEAMLDEVAQRRLEIEAQLRKAEAEEQRIKALAKDKKTAECRRILEQFMKSYDRQWEYGLEAFDRQAIITNEAERYYLEADRRYQLSARQSFEWSIRANRDLGDDPTDAEREEKERAQEYADFYRRQEIRDRRERNLRLNQLNFENQRLAQCHLVLANFVNQGKNNMILFENNFLDVIQDDNDLKTVYLDFTEKMKSVIAKFPSMPTVQVPAKPDPRLEQKALSEEKRDKISDLSFTLAVDLQDFLDQLVKP